MTEPERQAITGFTRPYWYKLEKQGLVPQRIKLGERRIGWLLSELEAWLAERAAARDVPNTAAPPAPAPSALNCAPARRR